MSKHPGSDYFYSQSSPGNWQSGLNMDSFIIHTNIPHRAEAVALSGCIMCDVLPWSTTVFDYTSLGSICLESVKELWKYLVRVKH